jgi:phosphoglycerate dehydrogenase-like enzyme
MADKTNVLVIYQFPEEAIERIRSVAPDRLNVVSANAEFYDEIMADWDENLTKRFIRKTPEKPKLSPEEKEKLLAEADAVFMSFPFPKTVPQRGKNLRWIHFPFAGVSNLQNTPCWGIPITVTSSRGYTNALPIAETVIAAAFAFAKRLDINMQRQISGEMANPRLLPTPQMRVIKGKTMGIVGMGGIGREVAQLAKGVGMRVVATRRSTMQRAINVDGVDEVFPASQLHQMLAECDFVAVCAMWTDETENLIDAEAIAAMKDEAYLINIARAEIVNEAAMLAALHSGKLSGAFVDVWANEFQEPPHAELLSAPNLTFMPHTSGRGDVSHAFALDVFCDNLRRFIDGEPLENVVDWERGY